MNAYTREWVEDTFPGGKWQANGEYKCSIRDEKTPSCFINLEKKTFCDFGGSSGKLSELCKTLNITDPYLRKGEGTGVQAPFSRPAVPGADEIQRMKGQEIWDTASPADGHEYLLKKQISANGARRTTCGAIWDSKKQQLKELRGDFLVVPAYRPDGLLAGIEQVLPNGKKYALGAKGFFILGELEPDRALLLAEGFATAASLKEISGFNVATAFGEANLGKTVKALREIFSGEIMIAPDAGSTARVEGVGVIPMPDGYEKNTDWNDLSCAQGIEAAKALFRERWKLAQAPRTLPEKKKRVFSLVKYGDIELTPPQFLVKGLIEKDTLSSIFGPSESGKSFIAVTLAASIATGLPFFGHQVEEGAVVYIAGEGKGGIKRRFSAWEEFNGVELKKSPLFISETAADFLDDGALEEVITAIEKNEESPLIIIIDTLSRSFGAGDENSSQDMKKFIDSLDILRNLYLGAVIMPVHHTGHAETGRARGSSVFRAALDTEFSVVKNGDIISMTATKTKDAERPQPMYFELEDVPLGVDEEGDPFGSAALRRLDEAPAKGKKPMTPKQRTGLESFNRAAEAAGTLDEEGVFIGVNREAWRPFYYETSTSDTPDTKKKSFQRIQNALVEAGILTCANDMYRLAGIEAGILENEYAKKLRLINRDTGTGPGQNGTCPASGTGLAGRDGTHTLRCVPMSPCVPPESDQKEENALSGSEENFPPRGAPGTPRGGEPTAEAHPPKLSAPSGAFAGGVDWGDVPLKEAEAWVTSVPGLMPELKERAKKGV